MIPTPFVHVWPIFWGFFGYAYIAHRDEAVRIGWTPTMERTTESINRFIFFDHSLFEAEKVVDND